MIKLMLLTTLRVSAAMLISLIIFLPLGIWIGLSNKRIAISQPIIQILAALPPNLFYPIIAIALIYLHQSLAYWSIPLIMIGTQWYILFNVIAGVAAIPRDIHDLANNYNKCGYYYFTKIILPAIFPYLITGIISAAGGAWNADILAELIDWHQYHLVTEGLGAYVADTSAHNLLVQAGFGCTLMCLLVAFTMVFIWRPLYRLADTRYRIQ